MLNAIRKFFSPPIFPDDEEKTRIAGVLFRILTATYFLLPTAVIVQVLNPLSGRFYMPLAVILTITTTVFILLAKQGYILPLSMALITSFLTLSTVAEIFAKGETRPHSLLATPAIVAQCLLL